MSDNLIETNEGLLPSSDTANTLEVSNVNPQGIDVGTNAIELAENPTPAVAAENEGVPASAVVYGDREPREVPITNVNFDGSIRRVEGDYVTDYYNGLPEDDEGDLDEELQKPVEPTPNDFEAVVTPADEGEELKKPRRFSR